MCYLASNGRMEQLAQSKTTDLFLNYQSKYTKPLLELVRNHIEDLVSEFSDHLMILYIVIYYTSSRVKSCINKKKKSIGLLPA